MKKNQKILVFCLLCIACFGCDRVTKNLAREHLQNREPLSFFHGTVRLEYAENTGAFLSFGADWPPMAGFLVFTILPLCFLCALLIYAIKKSGNSGYLKMTALGMIFSGGIGNLADRVIFNKHVSDFLNIGINGIRTGIFNVADVFISTGVFLLLLLQLRERRDIRAI
jgi:signal peptidase II